MSFAIMAPMEIGPRLLPAIRIDGDRPGWISIAPTGRDTDGRIGWVTSIDVDGKEIYCAAGLSSPAHVHADSDGVAYAMGAALSFLEHDADVYEHAKRRYIPEYLFSKEVGEWAYHMSSEIMAAAHELEIARGYPSEGE